MANTYLKKATRRRPVPQSKPLPGKEQIANSAGGYSFKLDKWKMMERFLILGSEGGSYYASEQKLTLDNVQSLKACLAEDGVRFVKMVESISVSGRAPKNDPAILALALAFAEGDIKAKRAAADSLSQVCRIGTHLFHFVAFVEGMRGWGRGLRSAVADWYLAQSDEKLAYQLVKYQQRDGWSHRDLIRLSHPVTGVHAEVRNAMLRHVVGKEAAEHLLPELMTAAATLKAYPTPDVASKAEKARLLEMVTRLKLPREVIPTEWLTVKDVWAALLPHMPYTALTRNLGKMTAIGLLEPSSDASKLVVEKLGDVDQLHKSRLHPIQILMAQRVYASNQGVRGSLTWTAVPRIVTALDDAFVPAFENVVPSNKRFFIGLDVSGSMVGGNVAGTPLSPREAGAAMVLATMRTEPSCSVYGFTHRISKLPFTAAWDLQRILEHTRHLGFGATDCSQPMLEAMKRKEKVDVFAVYTDSETWAGEVHPSVALQQYRDAMGIPAKLVVVGMVANEFSIADPNDPGMLDVVGFSGATPAVISDFASDGQAHAVIAEED